MKAVKRILFGASLLIAVPLTFADEGSVTITTPADGATLTANTEHTLSYEVNPGDNGDHVHIYVDDKEDILRELKGDYILPELAPGKHTIGIKVVNKNHTPTGLEQSITVTAN